MKAAVMAKTTSFGDTAWPPVATETRLARALQHGPWLNTKYAMAKSVYHHRKPPAVPVLDHLADRRPFTATVPGPSSQ
jgi:hypothetical protein